MAETINLCYIFLVTSLSKYFSEYKECLIPRDQ